MSRQDRDNRHLLERHEAALLELAKHETTTDDLDVALRMLTEAAGQTLDVERAGIWLFDDDRTKITCLDQYNLSSRAHEKGSQLFARDFPAYFEALEQNRTIVADDAVHHPVTRELAPSYLIPNGIGSMLDAPIRLDGAVAGIICHEHVGVLREWSPEEQRFAGSIADMASLALEHVERVRFEQEVRRRDELLDGVAKAANRMFAEAETQVGRRDALLAALAEATSALLAGPHAGDGVARALAIATEALECTGLVLYEEIDLPLMTEPQLGERARWGAEPEPARPSNASYRDLGLDQARDALADGVAFAGAGDGRLVVPVLSGTGIWGLVVATAAADREWARQDEHVLRVLANAIAAALR
jgi:GAF domain-containing protein